MGRKGSRYTLEEKLFYIGLVCEGGWAPWAVQREYGVRHNQVRQWLERFEAAGVDGLKPRSIHQKYTEEFQIRDRSEVSCGAYVVPSTSPRIWYPRQ